MFLASSFRQITDRVVWVSLLVMILLLFLSTVVIQAEPEIDVGAIRGTIFANLSPMPGLTVRLHTVVGSMVAETVSDSTGEYLFSSLENGYYMVSVNQPIDYTVAQQTVALEVKGMTHIVNFHLTNCCGLFCSGFSGNTNCSIDGRRNLSDIIRLIDRIFLTKKALCCEANGNIDGDLEAIKNLTDITLLIDHIFLTKNATAPCN